MSASDDPGTRRAHSNTARTLAKEEPGAFGLRVLVGHFVELFGQNSGAAEELHGSKMRTHISRSGAMDLDDKWGHGDMGTYHADVRLRVLLRGRAEHAVPVRSSEVRGRTQRRDRVLLGTDVLDLSSANGTHRDR